MSLRTTDFWDAHQFVANLEPQARQAFFEAVTSTTEQEFVRPGRFHYTIWLHIEQVERGKEDEDPRQFKGLPDWIDQALTLDQAQAIMSVIVQDTEDCDFLRITPDDEAEWFGEAE